MYLSALTRRSCIDLGNEGSAATFVAIAADPSGVWEDKLVPTESGARVGRALNVYRRVN